MTLTNKIDKLNIKVNLKNVLVALKNFDKRLDNAVSNFNVILIMQQFQPE